MISLGVHCSPSNTVTALYRFLAIPRPGMVPMPGMLLPQHRFAHDLPISQFSWFEITFPSCVMMCDMMC